MIQNKIEQIETFICGRSFIVYGNKKINTTFCWFSFSMLWPVEEKIKTHCEKISIHAQQNQYRKT